MILSSVCGKARTEASGRAQMTALKPRQMGNEESRALRPFLGRSLGEAQTHGRRQRQTASGVQLRRVNEHRPSRLQRG